MRRATFLLTLLAMIFTAAQADDGATVIKITHGPWLQNVTETEAVVSWTTNKPSVGWVEIAPTDSLDFYATVRPRYYDSAAGIHTISTLHHVKIGGLAPNTSYRYRAVSREVNSHKGAAVIYGRHASTGVYECRIPEIHTANTQSDELSFVIVNDIHGDSALFVDLFNQCRDDEYSFVIFNGDMMSYFNNEDDAMKGFIDNAVKLFAKDKPIYYVRGNHETRGTFAAEFQRYFAPFQPQIYTSFRRGPALLLMLDTGEDKPDSDIEYYGLTDYDGYRTEQAQWLSQMLTSKEYYDAPFKIVIAHIPPYIDTWHGNIDVAEKFMPPLNAARPDIMFCGHMHSLSYHEANDVHPFPILVNGNTNLVKVKIKGNTMTATVIDRTGRVLMEHRYER